MPFTRKVPMDWSCPAISHWSWRMRFMRICVVRQWRSVQRPLIEFFWWWWRIGYLLLRILTEHLPFHLLTEHLPFHLLTVEFRCEN